MIQGTKKRKRDCGILSSNSQVNRIAARTRKCPRCIPKKSVLSVFDRSGHFQNLRLSLSADRRRYGHGSVRHVSDIAKIVYRSDILVRGFPRHRTVCRAQCFWNELHFIRHSCSFVPKHDSVLYGHFVGRRSLLNHSRIRHTKKPLKHKRLLKSNNPACSG